MTNSYYKNFRVSVLSIAVKDLDSLEMRENDLWYSEQSQPGLRESCGRYASRAEGTGAASTVMAVPVFSDHVIYSKHI